MPDGPVSLLPNEATALENADLIYVSKDIGPGSSYESQRMTQTNLRTTLGLTGTEGFITRYAAGDILGTESNIYEDSDGFIGINTGGAYALDAFLTARFITGPGPTPTNIFDFGIDASQDKGLRLNLTGTEFFGGSTYQDSAYDSENFRMNFGKYLFMEGVLGAPTNLNTGSFNISSENNTDVRLLAGTNLAHNLYMHSDTTFANLKYNHPASLGQFIVDINGIDIAKFHDDGGVTLTELDTAAQTALTPSTGMMVYQTTRNQPEYYDGTQWRTMGSIYTVDDTLTANRTLTGSGNTLTFTDMGEFNYYPTNSGLAYTIRNDAGASAFRFYTDSAGENEFLVSGGLPEHRLKANANSVLAIGLYNLGIGVTNPLAKLHVGGAIARFDSQIEAWGGFEITNAANAGTNRANFVLAADSRLYLQQNNTDFIIKGNLANETIRFYNSSTPAALRIAMNDAGNKGFLSIRGRTSDNTTTILGCEAQDGTTHMQLRSDGVLILQNLPTASAGLPSGSLWNNSGVVNIV